MHLHTSDHFPGTFPRIQSVLLYARVQLDRARLNTPTGTIVMRLARAGKAASCPPERRDVVQELVSKMGRRRAIIFLGVLGGSISVLFLASGLLPTEPFSAQTTSPEGKIAYVKDGDIWVMDADGTNETNLTNTPETNERDPAWSSDGTRIAFTSDQDEIGGFTD